ncbi:MAG TPA: preprotein translocase subunit YajC [Opitutales bacterium]|jgi:preprotein translocase subunit YajC|nr:preprotein translocase subunit YajC [Opitutales bacterium]
MSSFIVLADGAASAALPVFVAQTGTSAPAPAPAPATASGTDLGAPQPSFLGSMALPLLILGVMFIFFIGPQSKRAKQQQKLIAELTNGDNVVTSSGIYGTIVGVKPDRFVLEISKGVRIEINRANVEMRAPDPNAVVDDKKA